MGEMFVAVGCRRAREGDAGLKLPPVVAPVQVIVIPTWRTDDDFATVEEAIERMMERLSAIARVRIDWRDDRTPGYNPGNPSCLTVGIAAECAIDATGPGCSVDSDGDRRADIAEAEAGFDPFDSADCVGSAGGQPAINCLFPTESLACNGDRIAEPAESECVAEREIRQRRSPSTLSGCDGADQPPVDDCVYKARDPGCDGFARESG